MPALLQSKPYQSLHDLVRLMHSRGMLIEDIARAERKLAQVGYYRLSGFWFPCRQYLIGDNGQITVSAQTGKPVRAETMLAGTSFNKVFELYLFDKRLRLLMLDALERVEIFVRTALADELGYHNPLAYEDASFIRPEQTRDYTDKQGKQRNAWADWTRRQQEQLSRCQEDHVLSHRHKGRAIPIWVAVEVWDFGTVSKYFELLKGRWQNRVCQRLGVGNAKVLRNWLQELNTLRNRCAHHTRIWNQPLGKPLPVLPEPFFDSLALDENARSRLLGLVAVLAYLLRQIGPSSQWLAHVADVVDTKPDLPGCGWHALGIAGEAGFPRAAFGLKNQ
jgi:abortive infection bacteriophage resistance protein